MTVKCKNSFTLMRWVFFESRLFWTGRASRKDLANYFDISLERASAAISDYVKIAPDNAHYDPSAKVYRATKDFKPITISTSSEQVLGHLLLEDGFLDPMPVMARMPVPKRALPVDILRPLLSCIAEGHSVDILYRSMSSSQPKWRRITPQAFGHDGFRWHVRAYCSLRSSFRDFVLGRIIETGITKEPDASAENDNAWNEKVTIIIGPDKRLGESQKTAIEMDFGMENSEARFEVRKAMLFYVLKQLCLHRDDLGASPEEQQIRLVNSEIRDLLR